MSSSEFLSDKFRNEVSWNGYPTDILKSGLQKYIRRNIFEKALYCAAELDLFKEAKTRGETIRSNFLHRIMIIFLEDIVNIDIFDIVDHKINQVFAERLSLIRNKEKEEILISELIFMMCKSRKSRICSHIRSVFNEKYRNENLLKYWPSINKYYDQIDKNEKERNNLNQFDFYCLMFEKYLKEKNILVVYYGFKIHYSSEKLKEKFLGKSRPIWFIFKNLSQNKKIDKFMNWYKFHLEKVKESFLCWLVPLLFEIGIIPEEKDKLSDDQNVNFISNWDKNRKREKIEIDDYVIDRHTKKGSKNNNSIVEFALNGAFVENEANFVNPLWKRFYEDTKRFEEGQKIIGESDFQNEVLDDIKIIEKKDFYPLESKEYDFIVRTQLVTSKYKQDVYLAKNNIGKLVVVKGPFIESYLINNLKENIKWKRKFNIPCVNFHIKKMIPDRWIEGTPLGLRNHINRNKEAFFIIFDSLINEEQIIVKPHSSKLWPETLVVDWTNIPLHFQYKNKNLSFLEMKDYVENLLFRYLFGISDLADRNFLMVKGRVISIDEEIKGKDISFLNELKKNKAKFVEDWLTENYEKLNIKEWCVNNDFEIKRLEKIKNKETCINLFRF
jgi:hypothetical protein